MGAMRLVERIDILGDEGLQRRVGRLSLVLVVAAIALAVAVAAVRGNERIDVWWWVSLAVGTLVALPVHELVHAAAFRLLCPGCRVGFGFQDAFLYTKTDGAVTSRGRMVAVLLAPAILVTGALAAATLCAGRPALAVLLAGTHLSGCAGDLIMAAAALREPGCTHVRDTDVGLDLLAED